MSYSAQMLSAASRARPELNEGAEEVLAFVKGCALPDGDYMGRGGKGDLYYTVFGVDCMLALGEKVDEEKLTKYLQSYGDGAGLDLMHLGCLARCWTRLELKGLESSHSSRIAERIEEYRSGDGGYHIATGSSHGSIYGCFMALAAYQDLGLDVPGPDGVVDSIEALRMSSGLFASERELQKPTVNAAVGAMMMLKSLGRAVDPGVSRWLLAQCHEKGGFIAAPEVPIPDLVSTATALYALCDYGVDLSPVKKGCINFLGSVWDDNGGFAGNWMDDTADCEYTFYALLSLGCLSGRRDQ